MNLSRNNTYRTRSYENSLIDYHYRSSLCTWVQPKTIPLILIEQYSVCFFPWFIFYVWEGTNVCSLYSCSRQLLGPDHFIWVIWLSGIFFFKSYGNLDVDTEKLKWWLFVWVPIHYKMTDSFFFLQSCQLAGPFASQSSKVLKNGGTLPKAQCNNSNKLHLWMTLCFIYILYHRSLTENNPLRYNILVYSEVLVVTAGI